jgi:serine/threonine protein kinase
MDDSTYQQIRRYLVDRGVVFTDGGLIGEGVYARVEAVEFRGVSCAAKLPSKSIEGNGNLLKESERGPELWAITNTHPGLVKHIAHFLVPLGDADAMQTYLVTVWERAEHSLDKLTPVDDHAQLRRYLQPVCEAIDFLNAKGIFHRDVKPENMLVFSDGKAKLGDLGSVRAIDSMAAATTLIGTPNYWPPEVFNWTDENQRVHPSTDVYSFVVSCVVLKTGFFPYGFDRRTDPGLKEVLKFKRDDANTKKVLTGLGFEDGEVSLILAALNADPEKRNCRSAKNFFDEWNDLAEKRKE